MYGTTQIEWKIQKNKSEKHKKRGIILLTKPIKNLE